MWNYGLKSSEKIANHWASSDFLLWYFCYFFLFPKALTFLISPLIARTLPLSIPFLPLIFLFIPARNSMKFFFAQLSNCLNNLEHIGPLFLLHFSLLLTWTFVLLFQVTITEFFKNEDQCPILCEFSISFDFSSLKLQIVSILFVASIHKIKITIDPTNLFFNPSSTIQLYKNIWEKRNLRILQYLTNFQYLEFLLLRTSWCNFYENLWWGQTALEDLCQSISFYFLRNLFHFQ